MQKKYQIPYEPFGLDRNERVIEIPWALFQYEGQKNVLDIGPIGAEIEYIKMLRNLNIENLYGIDITKNELPGFKMHFGDIRSTDFESNFFELIFCISTLEHVGKDNSFYSPTNELENPKEVFQDELALKEMIRILKPGGKLLITLPYGKYSDEGWFTNYDASNISRLIGSVECENISETYFKYFLGKGWYTSDIEELKDTNYRYGFDYEHNYRVALGSGGLVCLIFTK